MSKKQINTKEISKKNKIIDNAITILKQEFIGIDKQIDEIMENVRSWYLFPYLLTRPLVVSIWGLSGTGKTALIKRISELLDIEKDFVYWNFASIVDQSAWEIENDIQNEVGNDKTNFMFVMDEFQYAATKKENGEEINKGCMKTFWELIDTGSLQQRGDVWKIGLPYRIAKLLIYINNNSPMVIENGKWVNSSEYISHISSQEKGRIREYLNFSEDNSVVNNDDFIINSYSLHALSKLYKQTYGEDCDEFILFQKLVDKDFDGIIQFLVDFYEKISKGFTLNFKNSIIFVIGNLDDAYQMSFDVNPDMSPDQFKKITEGITVVDIKEALRKKFRNEQIARLGNIHVIYPSFSQKDFEQIIDLSLTTYEKEVYNTIGYHLKFDKTIKKLIYDEGVYPTHGTRPVFSTIYEIIKSRLPLIVHNIFNCNKSKEVSYITYSFDYENTIVYVKCYDKNDKEVCSVSFKDMNLRLKKLRDSDVEDEEQALCALHESGHFVMHTKLFGEIPEKIASKTTETSTGGFLMTDIEKNKKKFSKSDMLKRIRVLLGGYVAEKLFFGEEMSAGASHDLAQATKLASKLIRQYGMGLLTYVTTNTSQSMVEDTEFLIKEENQLYINNMIKQIIEDAENDVRHTFHNNEWRKMLKESAMYLCEHTQMPKEKMQEIYDNVADDVKLPNRSNRFYHNIIENL